MQRRQGQIAAARCLAAFVLAAMGFATCSPGGRDGHAESREGLLRLMIGVGFTSAATSGLSNVDVDRLHRSMSPAWAGPTGKGKP
jgi:hypothetical protein